jgi:hypothetical protein
MDDCISSDECHEDGESFFSPMIVSYHLCDRIDIGRRLHSEDEDNICSIRDASDILENLSDTDAICISDDIDRIARTHHRWHIFTQDAIHISRDRRELEMVELCLISRENTRTSCIRDEIRMTVEDSSSEHM